jgi:mRNA-degrading endonuclease YafQ of YafQ-DinJ toxin-antitoxin module
MKGALKVNWTDSFRRDYQRLPIEIQDEVIACVKDIQERDPLPASRRPHSVSPKGMRPKIFSLDVTSNKAYKLTFNLIGQTCLLRRVGTHSMIDRTP